MQSQSKTVQDYLIELPSERVSIIEELRATIKEALPPGFEEVMNYGMIGYVVPHSIYPKGYHCDPKLPLPFIGLASQKNHVAVYHMGIYADKNLYHWFTTEYEKTGWKLDMGSSCIRFKNMSKIPVKLIGDLCSKTSVDEWITLYESNFLKK